MQGQTQHAHFDNRWYKPGRNAVVRALWHLCNSFLLMSFIPGNGWRKMLLQLFGSRVGRGVVIKPRVNIKYPWNLSIGEYSWLGEGVWIDNLGAVSIGSNCCISQGAMLLCGNHNYRKTTFDLMVGNITLENGVWIGAKGLVCPGVTCRSHAVLSAGSIATSDLEAFKIYSGNPAVAVKDRNIEA
jgi:putative colanic acid biosynthesis acetyltransferase WcaF